MQQCVWEETQEMLGGWGWAEVRHGRKESSKVCITQPDTLGGTCVGLKLWFPHVSELRHLPTTPVNSWLRTTPKDTSSW